MTNEQQGYEQPNQVYQPNQDYQQGAQQPYAGAPVNQYQPVYDSQQPIYPMTSTDSTLRLIAFILNVITCVGCASFIFPLAWMVPMTVISWGIYKGTKANTVAFDVCTLIFLNLISGILYLCSTKNIKQG